MTAETQAKLYKEADARFQAQTGVVRKLDPKNPLDGKLIPVWADIYGKLLAQWKAGTIAWTFDHPVVVAALGDATVASIAAATSMGAAAGATALPVANGAGSRQSGHIPGMYTQTGTARVYRASQWSLSGLRRRRRAAPTRVREALIRENPIRN